MASEKKEIRTHLVCKTCMKLQDKLSVHLRRVCKKTASEAEISQAVMEAKENLQKINANLSIVSYKALNFRSNGFTDPQAFFADFLQLRGCIITDKPSERQPYDEQPQSEGEVSQAVRGSLTLPLRKKLTQAGIYKKHDLECPLFENFKLYLNNHFAQPSIKQMMENVSRYLYFMNPEKITLEFLNDLEKTKEFFSTLLGFKVSEGTVKNYVHHIGKYAKFVVSEQFPSAIEEKTREDAKIFLERLRKMTEEINQKSTKSQKRGFLPSPKDCCKVLKVARSQILNIFTRANSGVQLDDKEKILACYYLEALLMLKHLRKPSVIQNLTVKEWLEKKNCKQFGNTVTIVKMSGGTIVLPQEEELLFSIYFKCIRHTQLDKNSSTVEQFFISSKGKAIKNPSKDLQRFHEKFQQHLVTSKETTDATEKWALLNLCKEDRDAVKQYVHSGDQEEAVNKSTLIKAMFILHNLDDANQRETTGSPARKRRREEDEDEELEDAEDEEDSINHEDLVDLKEECFKRLLERCPVRLDHPPPTLITCKEVSEKYAQYCQDKWRREQCKIRIDDVVGHFRIIPTEEMVGVYLQRQGWKTNVPKASDALKAWRPHTSRRKPEELHSFEAKVNSQEWVGLVAVEDKRKGGYALKTTQVFKKGDVVCDYHGVLMDGKEGEDIQKTLTDDKCYVFFFRLKGTKMCFNATKAPCDCHPQMPSTFGRLINHSRKRANLKPVVKYVQDEKMPVILFEALKDLSPGTELFFNYGVKRKSYGEGADLDWLDE